MELDKLLIHLTTLREQAEQRYIAHRREEEDDEEYDADSDLDGGFWLSLEEGDIGWECGWQIRPDEATEWAFVATGATPTAAARALLTLMES